MNEERKEQEIHPGSTGIYQFQCGDWDGWVLHDIAFPLGSIRQYAVEPSAAEIRELMERNFLPGDQFQLSSNPLLVRWNNQFILVDTGIGLQMEGASGLLAHRLSKLGIGREQIAYVLITHLHLDHIGGAYIEGDSLFPNAKFFISEAEIEFWTQPNPDISELRDVPPALIELTLAGARNGLKALERQISSFKPDEKLIPGVKAVALPGHTPGHSGFVFQFGAEQFIAGGDFAHDPLLQLARPEWTMSGDTLRATTVETRKSLLKRLADTKMRFHAYHFPFPSIGHVRTVDGQSYEFVPERWFWI
jgi:glyoxylase-like metal-dependent hydrolase (beta-lactamase superfamily II)